MNLSKRQEMILKKLIEQQKPLKVRELSSFLKVSDRTIRYDLDHIDYELKAYKTSLKRTPKVGVHLESKDALLEVMSMWDNTSYVPNLDKEERLLYLGLILLVRGKPLSSEVLAELTISSRSTIISDFKELGPYIKAEYDLELWAKKHYGYSIKGTEKNIRAYFTEIVKKLLEYRKEGHKIHFLIPEIEEILDTNVISMIRKAIKLSKSKIPFWLPYESYLMIVARLRVMMFRFEDSDNSGYVISASLNHKQEYEIAKELAVQFEQLLNITVPDVELENIAYYLLYTNVKIVSGHDRMVDPKLVDTVYQMIKVLQNYITLSTDNIQTLKNELISHMELTLEKIQFGIPNVNHLVDDIKKNYFEEFHIAKIILREFENSYNVKTNDDEAGFITMYLLKNKELSVTKKTKNILMVCCSGKGASKFLATRIRNNIPNIKIQDIVSVFEVEEQDYETEHIDLIISTVEIKETAVPVIVVSPLITNHELGKISKALFNEDHSLLQAQLQQSMSLASQLEYRIMSMVPSDVGEQLMTKLSSVIQDFEETNRQDLIYKEDIEKPARTIGMVLMEIGSMIQSLQSKGYTYEFLTFWGLILHIVLAVPRWQSGTFNVEPSINEYKRKYPDIYHEVKETLKKIEVNFDFRILESEIIAIMRYLC